jgi:U3 small nucleolar RNA-associated protein 21
MQTAGAERSRVSKMQSGFLTSSDSPITKFLESGNDSGNYDPMIEHLKSLSPARADLEIRSLNPRVQNGFSELASFIDALTLRLKSRRDFELVNAWMAVFLKIHSDTVGLCAGCCGRHWLRGRRSRSRKGSGWLVWLGIVVVWWASFGLRAEWG